MEIDEYCGEEGHFCTWDMFLGGLEGRAVTHNVLSFRQDGFGGSLGQATMSDKTKRICKNPKSARST